MPKIVDHTERREQIATALLNVVSRDGLAAVSLRNVAAEAGVTAGMVQHYFPSKDSMLEFAMITASSRYARRITADLAELGDDPGPTAIITTLLRSLLPTDETESDDARTSLAFLAYVAGHPSAARRLAEGNSLLHTHLAGLIAEVNPGLAEPEAAATALHATAEGLAVQVLCAGLTVADARRALDFQLGLVLR